MDGKANHYARCGQNTKTYLHFIEKFKVERMQVQETLLGCLQCLESEVEKRVWHQDLWMLP
jgi:hypothetical protein